MSPTKASHGLTVVLKGDRLRATCLCGKWVRTTRNQPGGQERLAARYVQHVTGGNKP